MQRRRKRRPNWPYRLCWLAILAALISYIFVRIIEGSQTYALRSYGTDWGLAIVASLLDTTIAVWFVAFGAAIGSFLNVVAYRLPLGRSVGGHSGCPYCKTPIDSLDNVPVLAWVKLRGRCRACRLPISIQYPLVELTVGLVFFFVYITEFASGGSNLPDEPLAASRASALRVGLDGLVVLRIGSYLLAICGLIGAALIAVRGQRVPMKLFGWSILPLLVSGLINPAVVVVPWRGAPPVGPLESRMDVIVTMVCGAVAALALSRLLAPLLYPGMDPRLLAATPATNRSRQTMGCFIVVGCIVGWQATVAAGWSIVMVGMAGSLLFRRFRRTASLADLAVWAWLGLLIFRALWRPIFDFTIPDWFAGSWIQNQPIVIQLTVLALLLAPLCIVFRSLSAPPTAGPQAAQPTPEETIGN